MSYNVGDRVSHEVYGDGVITGLVKGGTYWMELDTPYCGSKHEHVSDSFLTRLAHKPTPLGVKVKATGEWREIAFKDQVDALADRVTQLESAKDHAAEVLRLETLLFETNAKLVESQKQVRAMASLASELAKKGSV